MSLSVRGLRPGRLAWALWTVTVALVVVAIVLSVLTLDAELPPNRETFLPLVAVVAVMGAVYGTVGAVVASRRPTNPIGWLFSVVGLCLAAVCFASGYADLALYEGVVWLPVPELVAWTTSWLFLLPVFIAPCALLLLFPDGRPPSPRWRPAVWLVGVSAVAAPVLSALTPERLDSYPTLENPLGLPGTTGAVVETLRSGTEALLGPAMLVISVAALIVRFRRSRERERAQIKWLAYAASVMVSCWASSLLTEDHIPGWLSDVLFLSGLAGFGLLPVAAGVAILRYRLYDIDAVISRTLVYGALTATLAAAYLGMVLLLQLALSPLTKESDLAIAGSTLAVAALFRPARRHIQALVDRRFYRRRYDAARTLERFGARLRDEVELDALGSDLRGVVRETMQPTHVSLWLRRSGVPR